MKWNFALSCSSKIKHWIPIILSTINLLTVYLHCAINHDMKTKLEVCVKIMFTHKSETYFHYTIHQSTLSTVLIIHIVISSNAKCTFIKFSDIDHIYLKMPSIMREGYFNYILERNWLDTNLNCVTRITYEYQQSNNIFLHKIFITIWEH